MKKKKWLTRKQEKNDKIKKGSQVTVLKIYQKIYNSMLCVLSIFSSNIYLIYKVKNLFHTE